MENIRQEQISGAKLYSTRYEYAQENILPGSSILEIGTLAGDYADYLIETCKPGFIELVDKFDQADWEVPGYEKRFDSKTHFDYVHNRFINNPIVKVTKGLYQNVMNTIENRFDYIYLDANHSEEGVRFQLEHASKLLKPNGVIGINDYTRYQLIRREDYGRFSYDEVCLGTIPAVNRFLLHNQDWKVKAFAMNDRMFSDIYIYRPENDQ